MPFASPEAALDSVAACLESLTSRPIHIGSANSGETLDCCCDDCDDAPLIRVESNTTAADQGATPLFLMSRNRCRDMHLDIVIVYSTCFQSFDGDGPDAVPIEKATKQGRANVQSWWEALGLLIDCDPANKSIDFTSASDDAPNGACFGWTMRLQAKISRCS